MEPKAPGDEADEVAGRRERAGDRPPAGRRKRVLTLAFAALVVAAGATKIVLSVAGTAPAGSDTSYPHYTVSAPDKLGNYGRLDKDDPKTAKAGPGASFVYDFGLPRMAMTNVLVTGNVGDYHDRDVPAFLDDYLRTTGTTLTDADRSARPSDTWTGDPGPHGGVMHCQEFQRGEEPAVHLCAWGDKGAFLSVVSPDLGRGQAGAEDLTRKAIAGILHA
ncbi:hypothetical protein ABT160_29975 [Streptomyces sp. NPDC001941]|uniref:hypothetical protein n=1 Tax=Streptomyces sp. NPDC001941 TaxID=3154659 RepID=UPI00331EDB06